MHRELDGVGRRIRSLDLEKLITVTLYFTAHEAVGGSPAQLNATADTLEKTGRGVEELADLTRRRVDSTDQHWQGKAADAYRAHAAGQVRSYLSLLEPLSRAAWAYRTLADNLAAAQHRAATAMASSEELGLGPGDLVGRPFTVMRFVLDRPEHLNTVGHLIGEVAGARLQASEARNRFVAGMALLRSAVAAVDGAWRDPDERDGRRVRNDELFRRSAGGDSDGGHFDNDWAGRAILERYLRGGDDWTIVNDEDWSDYMMGNQLLRSQLTGPVQDQARETLNDYLAGRGRTGSFAQNFAAEIENGEGIVGYQYLHGTNEEQGGFHFAGGTTVRPTANGNYEVIVDGRYTWNDVIDPNPKYETDTWKSQLGEVLTLGQADPYDFHVTWQSQTRVTLDRHGNVVSMAGYPAP